MKSFLCVLIALSSLSAFAGVKCEFYRGSELLTVEESDSPYVSGIMGVLSSNSYYSYIASSSEHGSKPCLSIIKKDAQGNIVVNEAVGTINSSAKVQIFDQDLDLAIRCSAF